MNLSLPMLIGSLLFFKQDGINEQMLIHIENYSKNNNLKILTYHDMAKIICELDDYRYCFDLKRDRITTTDFYKNDRQLFKERFFDRLSVENRNIIYKLLNNI